MAIKKKFFSTLIIAVVLMFAILFVPTGKTYAAQGIKVISSSQQNTTVNLKWEKVSGASFYTIMRKFSDAATGKLDNKSKITWRQTGCTFKDQSLTTADNGKVVCYQITAFDKNGKKILSSTRFFMKTPTCLITSVSDYNDGKVTFKWKAYNYINSYTIKLVEGTNFNSSSVKTMRIDGSKSQITVTGLKPGKTYSLRVYGNASGLFATKKIESTGWYAVKTIKTPTEAELKERFFQTKAIVVLHNNDGSVYKEITLDKGSRYTLPSMLSPAGYTFIGWGPKKNIRVSESTPYKTPYFAYDQLSNLQRETHLYAVLFERSREKDLTAAQMFAPNISKYKKVIFVGDSRMERTRILLNNKYPEYKKKGIAFVAEGGAGYPWLVKKGYSLLLEEINKTDSTDSRPIAVVFNLGVNHLTSLGDPTTEGQNYVEFYKKAAPELKEKGCKLFYMTVNPIIGAQSIWYQNNYYGEVLYPRKECYIRTINDILYKNLSGTFEFIDTYNWLLQTGFGTANSVNFETTVDDGVHFTFPTTKRILWKALSYLERCQVP